MKLKLGTQVVDIDSSVGVWDPCLCCPLPHQHVDYFANGTCFTASKRIDRSFVHGFATSLAPAIDVARNRSENVACIPDDDARRVVFFVPRLLPSIKAEEKAAAIVIDIASIREKIDWCENMRITQFAYLASLKKNEAMLEGVAKGISELKTQNKMRWLFEMRADVERFFVSCLVRQGAEIVERPLDREALGDLLQAIREDDLVRAETLSQRLSDINQLGGGGLSPLSLASSNGLVRIMDMLVKKGADIELQNPIGKTPLMRAAQASSINAVQWLLDQGAKIDAQSFRGESALMFAAVGGSSEIVQLLINRGANIFLRNRFGQSALDFARQEKHEAVIRALARIERP